MWQVPATLPGPRLLRFPAAWLFNDSPSLLAGQWDAPLVPSLSVSLSLIFGSVLTPPFCTFQDEEGLTFSSPCVLAGGQASPPLPLGQFLLWGTPPPTLSPFFCSSWVSPQILPCKQASVSSSRAIKQNPSFCYPAPFSLQPNISKSLKQCHLPSLTCTWPVIHIRTCW